MSACGGLLALPPGDAGSTQDASSSDAGFDTIWTPDVGHDVVADAASGWALSFHSIELPTNLLFIEDVEIADVTGDGRADVVLAGDWYDEDASDNASGVIVYAQQPDGTLAAPVFTDPGSVYLGGLTPGDVTNDGRTDLVFPTANGLAVVAQDSTGHLLPAVSAGMDDAGYAGTRLALGRFGPDTKLDAVQGDLSNNGQSLWLWLQTTNGFEPTGPFAMTEFDRIASGDLDGDGDDDLVVSYIQTPYVSVVPQTGPATLGAAQNYAFTTDLTWDQVEGLAVGDVTGDGLADVVVSHGGNNPDCHLAVLAQRNGKLDPFVTYDTLDLPGTVRIADMNGDGRLDIVVEHAGWEKLGVYLQGADGTLQPEQLFAFKNTSAVDGNSIAVGDLDGDGRPDVAGIGDQNESLLLLLSK